MNKGTHILYINLVTRLSLGMYYKRKKCYVDWQGNIIFIMEFNKLLRLRFYIETPIFFFLFLFFFGGGCFILHQSNKNH